MSAYVQKIRRSLQSRGPAGTITHVFNRTLGRWYHLLRRRAVVQVEARFDRRYHVDTGGRFLTDELHPHAHRYQASEPRHILPILHSLKVDYSRFVFCDYGCGKGKVLLLAAQKPFRRIIGVELMPNLAAIARENLRTYTGPRCCREIEVYCGDAITYNPPAEASILYFYNPFSAEILRPVVERIGLSLKQSPRELYVIYYNPAAREVFDSVDFLRLVEQRKKYLIYRSL